METAVVLFIVAGAAVFSIRGYVRQYRAGGCQECTGGCQTCASGSDGSGTCCSGHENGTP